MAEALYRKYRPQVFGDVVGQEHIERTIRNAIEHDKTSHAYLFTGPRGTGKTTTARLLAKALLCEKGPTAEPDGTCQDCLDIANGTHPDVYELDAASRTGVDNVREEIIGRVQFAPTRGRYKIYIIDEVHMLSTAAFNALLKTLEEPPSHVVFIMCTTDPQKVPETIHSRCQRFDFHRISNEAIIARLGTVCGMEGIEYEPEALELIAYRAEGGMRNALTSLEQLISFGDNKVTVEAAERMLGSMDSNQIAEIIDAIAKKDAAACFNWTAELVETGADLAQFVRDLAEYVRNLYLMSLTSADIDLGISSAARSAMSKQVSLFGPDCLSNLLVVLGDLSKELRSSSNPRLSFEIALTRMVRPESDLTISALAQRVEELERALASGQPAAAQAVKAPASSVPMSQASASQGAVNQSPVASAYAGQTSQAPVANPVAQANQSVQNSRMGQTSQAPAPITQQPQTPAYAAPVPQRSGMQQPQTQARKKASGAEAALAAVQAARDALNQQKSRTAAQQSAPVSMATQNRACKAPSVPQDGQAPNFASRPNPAPQAQRPERAAYQAQGVPAAPAQAKPQAVAGQPVVAQPVVQAAQSAAQSSVSAGGADISNPANLQRMWRAITTAMRKANPARGVLFMNAKVSATPKGAIEVAFSADNEFAYTAAAKPEVTQLLAQIIQQVAGVSIPFELKLLGKKQGSAAPSSAALQASAGSFTQGGQSPISGSSPAPGQNFVSGKTPSIGQASAPTQSGFAAETPSSVAPATPALAAKPAPQTSYADKFTPPAEDEVPLDIYDSFASSYDEDQGNYPDSEPVAKPAVQPSAATPVETSSSQQKQGSTQPSDEDAKIEKMFNDAFGGGVRFYDLT